MKGWISTTWLQEGRKWHFYDGWQACKTKNVSFSTLNFRFWAPHRRPNTTHKSFSQSIYIKNINIDIYRERCMDINLVTKLIWIAEFSSILPYVWIYLYIYIYIYVYCCWCCCYYYYQQEGSTASAPDIRNTVGLHAACKAALANSY